MFNLKKAKNRKYSPQEKSLEKDREFFNDVAEDNAQLHEKMLSEQHRGEIDKITESQMERKVNTSFEKLPEKKFEREKIGNLYVPKINAFVDKLVKEKREQFKKEQNIKADNWTLKSPTQNGELPAWPKSPSQHNKTVLPNDVNRNLETEPLIGGKIVKASIDDAVFAIKSGETRNYDEKIVEILKIANDENRELTADERNAINYLKRERTLQFIKES